ncbi:MAG: SDR family NAD(P)-dependent oxidoreductase [Pseudomonadota bacterium]
MLDLGLKGKVAIITGGSDGLGRASAEKLAAEGVKVAIAARRKDHLEKAADEIRKATGGEVLAHVADVSRAADCEALVKAVIDKWGDVDILFNNAGTSAANAFEEVGDAAWQADWDLKVMGAVRMTRLVLPYMKKRHDGRIVNITTVNGKVPRARGLPTSVTRAAGINLTKSLANEYAADNIRINTICIGIVRTAQMARRAKGDLEAHFAEQGRLRVPLGRVAHASEFADLLAFLVSDRASYITGASINFDGGSGLTV